MAANTVLRAVYTTDAVEAKGTATITKASYNIDTQKLSFVAYLTPPEGATITAAGLVAASGISFKPDMDLNLDNAEYKKASAKAVGTSIPWTYTWTKTSVNPGDVWYVRAYVIYTDAEGAEHTVYGDLFQFTA